METNQDQLRKLVKRRCTQQTIAAKEIGISNIHLNYWLKGHKDLGTNTIGKVRIWLDK